MIFDFQKKPPERSRDDLVPEKTRRLFPQSVVAVIIAAVDFSWGNLRGGKFIV
jgi:hypothetical protein